MRKIHLIPLLMMTPILFMGNSPAPYADFARSVGADEYQLNNLTYGDKEKMGDLELYPFTLDIQNNSEYYLCYRSLDIVVTGKPYLDDICTFRILSPYYDDDCIKPHDTMTVMGYALDTYTIDQLRLGYGYGYSSEGVSVEFTNPQIENTYSFYDTSNFYKKTYQYNVLFDSISFEQESNYSYAMIIEYTINGHSRYYFTRDVYERQNIHTFEEATEIEIKNISILKESYRSYYYGGDIETVLKGFGVVCLVLLGVLLGIGWVVSSIIVLVKQPWRRKNEG